MKELWHLTADEYIEIVEISKELGIKPGESMEPVLRAYMEIKGKKSAGCTELTMDEMLKEIASKGNKVLGMETKDGKTIYKKVKRADEDV